MRKTSLDAYKSISLADKKAIWAKIILAAKKLPAGGTFEEIAKKAKLEPAKVWKRLPELVQAKIMFNTGSTRPTSSGRKAMVRQLYKKFAA